MGQAQTELPASASSPDADDLLSKMASDEIDRLLAEAENDSAEPPIAAQAAVEPAVEVVAPAKARIAPTAAAAPSGAAAPSDQIDTTATTLDALFKETSQAPPAEPADAKTPAPIDAATSPSTERLPAAPTVAGEPPAAPFVERRGAAAPAEKPAVAPVADDLDSNDRGMHEPILVRILEIINSPFDHLDDSVRNVIGMIGLVTLFNAIVVLAYVHFVRKHQ